jgi:hypothetical protein
MNPADLSIHLSDPIATAEVRPALGGWLTRYA